jgi:hypothetical protein
MPSKKASARVSAPQQSESARESIARRSARRKAADQASLGTRSQRQFQKTSARAIQGHIQARGQRQQAKRDTR